MGRWVDLELVSDELPRRLALLFQHLAEETFSSSFIPALGHQNVENIAILINCSPQVDLPALNPHEQLINVPYVAQATLLPSNRLGVLGPELETPAATGLIGNDDTTFSHQILDISQTEREPVVEPHSMTDDFTRKAMAFVEHSHPTILADRLST